MGVTNHDERIMFVSITSDSDRHLHNAYSSIPGLQLVWIFICLAMSVASFVFFTWTTMCNRLRKMNLDNNERCVDLKQFDFLLPEVSIEHQVICDEGKKKEFCVDYVSSNQDYRSNPIHISSAFIPCDRIVSADNLSSGRS